MTYKYLVAGSPTFMDSPKGTITDTFQAMLTADFYTTFDWYIIQEESSIGSKTFVDINVRINQAIDSVTGVKLGDDYKLLLFQDLDHTSEIGHLYSFDSNYWIVSHSEVLKSLGSSCTVRRCNNILRWVDDNGKEYSEYCVADNKIKRPTDGSRARDIVTPEGFIEVMTQGNDRTRLITDSQRFLFGNTDKWSAYRTYGGGVNNFLNQQTSDNESANLIYFMMGVNYINEDTDDIVNGIADKYRQQYAISASPTSITGNVSDNFQLAIDLTRNGVSVTKPITYITSASDVATVSASGVVSLVTTGSANISASMTNNSSASTVVLTTVSGSLISQDEIRITPNQGYVLQEDTETYTVYAWASGSQQADTFTFATSGSVPATSFTFTTVSDNSFSIKNEYLYLDAPLVVTCTSSASATKDFSIELRGAW